MYCEVISYSKIEKSKIADKLELICGGGILCSD